ncbi:MAG: hypothetical protein AB7P17_14925 [Nitrospirales bacterium]|nr:hypothetical protein [Nitrospirales bacterium]
MTAAAFWVGGMLFLSLVAVPLLKQAHEPVQVQRWFVGLACRFRTLVWWALSLLVGTGALLLPQWVADFSSPLSWPRPILFKLFLVLGLISVSLLHDRVIGPKVRLLRNKTPIELSNHDRLLIRLSPLIGRMTLLLGLTVLFAAVSIVRN